MILANLKDSSRYYKLNPLFKKVFKFVRENDLSQFPNGRIVLDGDEAFINICEPTLKKAEDQKLEVHREYIDIHIPLSGSEICGVTNIDEITVASDEPFNEADDFAVYSEPARTYFTAHQGDFYIVFPEDAHAPIIGEGKLKKAIVKVRVDAIDYSLPF